MSFKGTQELALKGPFARGKLFQSRILNWQLHSIPHRALINNDVMIMPGTGTSYNIVRLEHVGCGEMYSQSVKNQSDMTNNQSTNFPFLHSLQGSIMKQ